MLLPRPEIRIATRLGSRMVGRGPIPIAVPCAGLAADGAAATAFLDSSDLEDCLARALQIVRHAVRRFRRDDHGHADAAVEGPRHLLRRQASALLQERE